MKKVYLHVPCEYLRCYQIINKYSIVHAVINFGWSFPDTPQMAGTLRCGSQLTTQSSLYRCGSAVQSGVILMLFTCIVWLKLVSYAHTNYDMRSLSKSGSKVFYFVFVTTKMLNLDMVTYSSMSAIEEYWLSFSPSFDVFFHRQCRMISRSTTQEVSP